MSTAYIFPGQGAQFAGMGLDLYRESPAARDIFDRADSILGFPLSKMCFEGPEDELKKTMNAQPALLTMSIACLEALREKERETGKRLVPEAEYMAGHSLGEYTALTAAGSLSFEDAVRLSRDRGQYMYEAGQLNPGGMAAVIAVPEENIRKLCEETGTCSANFNCPGQVVISGTLDAVEAACGKVKDYGGKFGIPLKVSGAFHSPFMKPAAEKLTPEIEAVSLKMPSVKIIGNTTAGPLKDIQDIRSELEEQVNHSVLWEQSVQYMISQGVDTFVEIGPGQVLAGLMKRINPDMKTINIGNLNDISSLS
ncbi:MAG: ACP S-malonyltransferase [Oscillospiraceae bacterium]